MKNMNFGEMGNDELDPNFDPVVDQTFPIIVKGEIPLNNRLFYGYTITSSVVKKGSLPSIDMEVFIEPIQRFKLDYVVLSFMKYSHPSVRLYDQVFHGVKMSSRNVLRAGDWNRNVVSSLPDEIFDMKSLTPHVASKSFVQLYEWFFHLSIPGVTLPCPIPGTEEIYAHILSGVLTKKYFNIPLWIRIPIFDESGRNIDYYEVWNRLRTTCQYPQKLTVDLQITEDLPDDDEDLFRWIGEHVQNITIPTTVFLTKQRRGKKPTPYLSPRHVKFIRTMMNHVNQYVIEVKTPNRSSINEGFVKKLDLGPYFQHLRAIFNTLPKKTALDNQIDPYRNVLQIPLQPLAKNLTNVTYMLFEQDPTKYQYYQWSIERALEYQKSKYPLRQEFVVMVLGAGRGPLIKAVFRASVLTHHCVKVYAIEKNVNALYVLRTLNKEIWGNEVRIVETDIRNWNPPEKADIIVSELLGSFGDNELSPECLSPIENFLQPGTGLSIPCSSTSFLVPASSSKLYWESLKMGTIDPKYCDMACVSNVHDLYLLDEAKKCFFFEHPYHHHSEVSKKKKKKGKQKMKKDSGGEIDFTQFAHLEFIARATSRIDGLVGYFESVLFKIPKYNNKKRNNDDEEEVEEEEKEVKNNNSEEIMISILPRTKTENMFSWFPIWFPLGDHPLNVKKGEKIVVSMWRCQDSVKVWYEWQVKTPVFSSRIINPSGKSYFCKK